MTDAVRELLIEQIRQPETQWSLGTFGGIAEFSRDLNEHADIVVSDERVSAVTARGGVAIDMHGGIRPFASESVGKQGWNHRVALCLPQPSCEMNRRTMLSELGPDHDALRDADRDAILFDLGLDALQADLCIRVSEPDVVASLRACCGRQIFEPGNPAMGVILSANPHRVFISRLGRVEVYQPIPTATGKSPDGPHTHVLPKLLRAKRTHPATEPIPVGLVPCAHFYPAHPAKDGNGIPTAFDPLRHSAFQQLLRRWGSEDATALKMRVLAGVLDRDPAELSGALLDRTSRAVVRVALRQLKATGNSFQQLDAWLNAFDPAAGDEDRGDAEDEHA
jgi:hypothetical protein